MMKAYNQKKFPLLFFPGSLNRAPVLDDLLVDGYDAGSITLARPTLSVTGDPLPIVNAYIGLESGITITGSTVTGSIEGPVDVSNNDYIFDGLTDRTRYRIIVVASNSHGNSMEYITQQTRGSGLWTWVSGDNTLNQSSIYGTKGVPAAANKPGARWQFVSWIDSSDNLWLFGGNSGGGSSFLNDLWKFDGTMWTWVSGDNTSNQAGVYGAKGVAADTNKPGARFRSVSWIDSSDILWLFGGNNDDLFSDLWKFDGTRWTWVSGDNIVNQAGIYGTKGVAADANKPGGRDLSVSWIDTSDNLWLFGGGLINNNNDLWKFDGSRWTWVSGDNTANQSGIYGTKGVASDNNKPGGRWGSISWIDLSGNLWLFGGMGIDGSGSHGSLNDLWKFDGTRWTWVSGDNTINQTGVYGAKGVAADVNKPGGRWASISWIDSNDNLWLFGGVSQDLSNFIFFNDLWKFDGSRWTWVSGDNIVNQPGVYGTRGAAAASNKPGAHAHSVSWIDSNGNLWLFGGVTYATPGNFGFYNDLWKYSPE